MKSQRDCLLLSLAAAVLLLATTAPLAHSLVVPSELPSILSVIYSNIPPIKKGTDSRLGFGFRVGEHADFQVLVELGPQQETRPIGDPDSENSYSKRQLDKNELRKQYWRQQAKLQQQKQLEAQATSTERNAANWLQNWSADLMGNINNNSNNKKSKSKTSAKTVKPTKRLANGMPEMPVMRQDALKQLQQLYKLATTSSTTETPKEENVNPEIPNQDAPPASPLKKLPYFGGSLNLGPPAGFAMPQQDLSSFKEQKSKQQITKELMDVSLDA